MRSISLMLALLLMLYSVPLAAFAEGEDDPLWNRPSYEKKVYKIGQRILQANGITERITFLVSNEDIRNASAQRGGGSPNTITVYQDLLQIIENDDELAAVLSHEIAHITRRHHAKSAARTIPALVVMGVLAGAAAYGGNPLQPAAISNGVARFSQPMMKSLETDADNVGIDYLVKAGYNPLAMETLMAKITADAGALTTFFSSHPLGTKRLANIRQQITTKYPEFITPEIASNLPGAPYQHEGTDIPALADNTAESPATQPVAEPGENDEFYKKLALIAENGSTEKTEATGKASSKTPESAAGQEIAANTAEETSKEQTAQESSVPKTVEEESFYNRLTQIAGDTAPKTDASPATAAVETAKTNTPVEPFAKSSEIKTAQPKTSSTKAKITQTSKSTTVSSRPTPARAGAPAPVKPSGASASLRKPPQTVSYATQKTAPSALKAEEPVIKGTESVAELLLNLKPHELSLIKALRQQEYMNRESLQAEMGDMEWTAIEVMLQGLQRKKLIRIVGAEPGEMILLSDWAAAELRN